MRGFAGYPEKSDNKNIAEKEKISRKHLFLPVLDRGETKRAERGCINAADLGMIIRQKRIHETLYSRGKIPDWQS
ncbi:MAG: hypothetical protein M0041_01085 [Nitrospiraceae bacterium]|nr:hypothetical protein [Nitrospiraceae bacterium]